MGKMLEKVDLQMFLSDIKTELVQSKTKRTAEEKQKLIRCLFFRHFHLSDNVPAELVPDFIKVASVFYNRESLGYNGIMEEIKDRTELYSMIAGHVEIREFLKHGEGKSDFYDRENKISYEKKTGCGDWLRSERSATFEEVIAEYKRKKTLLRWDYEYKANKEGMNGAKTVKKGEEEAKRKEGKKPAKEYDISIHIETTYKAFFDYLATYPKGIGTFFKESTRSGVAGVYVWELQTIKNSKKKIEFLQNYGKTAKQEEEAED